MTGSRRMYARRDWHLRTSSDSSENGPPGNPAPAGTGPGAPCSASSSFLCPARSPNSRAFITLFSPSPSHSGLPSVRAQLRCYFLAKPSVSPNDKKKMGLGHPSVFSPGLCSTPLTVAVLFRNCVFTGLFLLPGGRMLLQGRD